MTRLAILLALLLVASAPAARSTSATTGADASGASCTRASDARRIRVAGAAAIPRCHFIRPRQPQISHVARRAITRSLIETTLGQHLALGLAAHLARSKLVPDPPVGHDALQIADT